MTRGLRLAVIWLALGAFSAVALADSPSPYTGLEARPIKALSAEQIADLRDGRGMGLALTAELNGWPGPTHVLELVDELRLTAPQRERTAALLARMQAEAKALGERLIAEEAALDASFRDRTVTVMALYERLHGIGALQGELRAVHLRAHLEQAEILSAEQMAAYNRLRGYGGGAGTTADPARPHRGMH